MLKIISLTVCVAGAFVSAALADEDAWIIKARSLHLGAGFKPGDQAPGAGDAARATAPDAALTPSMAGLAPRNYLAGDSGLAPQGRHPKISGTRAVAGNAVNPKPKSIRGADTSLRP